MKHIVAAVVVALASAFAAEAVVAHPDAGHVTQPDGSTLTLLLHGDEWFNFYTTADGYTVVPDEHGCYRYATLQGNQLTASDVVAHDAAQRSASERQHVAAITPYLVPDRATITAMRSPSRLHGQVGHYDYKNFRGLVILVEYNDCPFSRSDADTLWHNMINQHDFKGYMSDAMFPELIPCTGSVRDYFYASSGGEFDPVFDVVGPVKIGYSQYDAYKTSYAQTLVAAALDSANALINYKDYDRNRDGTVDMVFFVFAGAGSNFSGNDSRLIWPHASSVTGKVLDNVSIGRYACSTELFGRPESRIIDGIGTICHEFSHVLGVPDLYDTDGTSSGGSSIVPGKWSLMSSGNYLNQSRTPCQYSVYERYAAGFSVPTTLTASGHYTVEPVGKVNGGYRLDSNVKDEFFLLEARENSGWDEYLPGEGMLVWRVDSTNATAWENNKVNCNPSHNYMTLLRAGNGNTDDASDPFPGSAQVTTLDNTTTPSLLSWTGAKSNYALSNIALTGDGAAQFDLKAQAFVMMVEDFEDMALTTSDATGIQGVFTTWSLKSGARVADTTDDMGDGSHTCTMLRNSELVCDALPWDAQSVEFTFYNPTTTNAVVRTYYRNSSTDVWAILKDNNGQESVSVAAGTSATLSYNTVLPEGAGVRIVEYSGNRTSRCAIDNVSFMVEAPRIPGDINGDGEVNVIDVNLVINMILSGTFNPDADINGDGEVNVIDVNLMINTILG